MGINLLPRTLRRGLVFWCAVVIVLLQIDVLAFFITHPSARGYNPFAPLFVYSLVSDVLSVAMLFCIGLVVFVTVLVARHFLKDPEEQFNFLNLVLLALAGMNALVLTSDIFSLYVFLEVVSAASFIMIAFHKKHAALAAAFRYIMLSILATTLMVISIALLLLLSGDTGFSAIRLVLKDATHSLVAAAALGMFLCGTFIKSGLVPFHGWLPESYANAPAPASVLLAGIVTKVGGVYVLMRIVYSVFGLAVVTQQILMMVGALSVVVAALIALVQVDFKKMLAYSSISQVGYIILGFACGTGLGFAAAVFHMFNHATFKSLLFVNAAAVQSQLGTRNMDKMGGLSTKMPFTGFAAAIGSLSTAGIPPLAGFWSKLLIIIALWVSGHHMYAYIAILASVITLAYMLRLQSKVFFGILAQGLSSIRETSFMLTLPSLILVALTIGLGIFFPFALGLFESVTRSLGRL